jgi:predicted deacylase
MFKHLSTILVIPNALKNLIAKTLSLMGYKTWALHFKKVAAMKAKRHLPPLPNSPDKTTTPMHCSFKVLLRLLVLMPLLLTDIAYAKQVSQDEDQGFRNKGLEKTTQKVSATSLPEISEEKNDGSTPVAPNVDLKEIAPAPVPIAAPALTPPPSPSEKEQTDSIISTQDKPDFSVDTLPAQEPEIPKVEIIEQAPFVFLGSIVPPATATRLAWSPKVTIAGLTTPTPVLVINGKNPGDTLCMTAAIHGDELNGVEIIRRVMYDIDPEKLSGKIIGVPIVNIKGFQRGSRYLSDRRDLNRNFPGDAQGSLAARIAHSLFNEVIIHCDALIDLHTGSLRRTNLLQVRADMSDKDVMKFTEGFDETVVVHSIGEPGMLRQAALDAGIIAITLEAGESLRLQEEQVDLGVKSINSLLQRQNMYSRIFSWGSPEPTYYRSQWIRANTGGILFSHIDLGHFTEKGGSLGTVTDPITNESSEITSPIAGRIIGMAVNQVVMPGFAAYHLGIEAPEDCLATADSNASTVLESELLESQEILPGECDKR